MEEKIVKFELNPINVKHIPFTKFTNDFIFYVNNKKYHTNRFTADLLSPTISKLHFTDESTNEFHIKTQHSGDFKRILELVSFTPICIENEEIAFFEEVLFKLGNEEYLSINPIFKGEITIDNVVSRIANKFRFHKGSTKNSSNYDFFEDEIKFLSEHFHEIIENKNEKENLVNLATLGNFGIEFLEMILQKDNLKLDDEDSLFNFVLSIYQKNTELKNQKNQKHRKYHISSALFEHVQFEYLSKESLEKFIKLFDIDNLNSKIWKSLCNRLILAPAADKNKNKQNDSKKGENKSEQKASKFSEPIEIPYKDTLNDGLFAYLHNKCGGDPSEKGLVEVTASTTYVHPAFKPKNTINALDDENNSFVSQNYLNQWVCYNFKNSRFKLFKYQIRSRNHSGNFHLKNWVIQTSKDGNDWTEVDRQTNCDKLNGPSHYSTFVLQSPPDEFVQFIRLRQIGENWHNNYYLDFNSIEFYGELIESI
ncbi:hypothetical protein TRFO_39767 [Tritrichomonas foetus]|uniref:F5/8 type C domain-containing protein n=1 Tax=Tritrichomonas foetus TaxID=1144522 RepID=A0A1J4J3L6_9EUKA|nr:hypothetical protein TRFO_39767 [Tritrichomonas foetus]|eukprot:OHS94048.1 hypothetical protein TRFO_39767 [Tritrichomonas foetus]